jgi:UDP-2,3-diacylglucosamine pyrophosphatase LpxH
MLVIISDLHLTDGTTTAALDAGAIDIFTERLRDLAFRASWRTDGQYRPVERIDLVLLGDVLDIMRSYRWLRTNTRPWDDASSPQLAETVSGIVDDTLKKNNEFVRRLRAIATEGLVSIPQGTMQGQPAFSADELPLPVRTYYMVGNTDWPLHLRGPQYDILRHKVAHNMGLSNQHNQPFPHEPGESEEILEVMRRHRVVARHGDVFDPLHFSEDRDTASLGDALIVELLGRFLAELERPVAGDLPAAAIAALAEMDHIRPLLLAPVWLDQLLERTVPNHSLRKTVKRIWDATADVLLQLEVVRSRDRWSPLNLIDGLSGALKFSRRETAGWTGRVGRWLQQIRGAENDSFATHALAEPDFRNRRARHIVYGHTHQPETIPLEASYADGYVLNQVYFNAGTWRRTYRGAINAAGGQEFIPSESMTYLAFFQGDERSGRPFETWTGTLGMNVIPAQATKIPQRIDAAEGHGIARPHFANTPQGVPAMNVRRSL